MPPWLQDLLKKNNSLGMLDTLVLLAGVQPTYAKMPQVQSTRSDGQRSVVAAETWADKKGNPVIGLTPYTLENFANDKQVAGYQLGGEIPLSARLGDATIQHEFGHVIANAGQLGTAFNQIDPDAWKSEEFADHFQNAFQFLRNHKTDTSKLSPITQRVVDVLLAQPLFKDHPLNTQRTLKSLSTTIKP